MTDDQISPYFIAIDDDRIDNMICSKIIQQVIPGVEVKTFTDPEDGLEFFQSSYLTNENKYGILFLDINMPTLTGWEVLERFKNFPDDFRKRLKIFILSSSVSPRDKELADNNPMVCDFIQKPLTTTYIKSILKNGEYNIVPSSQIKNS